MMEEKGKIHASALGVLSGAITRDTSQAETGEHGTEQTSVLGNGQSSSAGSRSGFEGATVTSQAGASVAQAGPQRGVSA